MKKFMFLTVALAAMIFASCGSKGGEKAEEPVSYGITRGGLNSTGDDFKAFDYAEEQPSDYALAVEVNGEKANVSLDLKLVRTEEEVKGEFANVALSILTTGDDDFKMELPGDPAAFVKAAGEAAGTEGTFTFKGEVDKAVLDSINGKKCALTLILM